MSNHVWSCSTVNKMKQLRLGDPVYNRLVQRRNLRTPFVHAAVTRNTGRLLVQFQQLMHLVDSTVHCTAASTQHFI